MEPDRIQTLIDELQEDVEYHLNLADAAEANGKGLEEYCERQWAYATYAARRKLIAALLPRDATDDILSWPRPDLRVAE